MIKLPTSDHPLPPAFVEQRTQFAHDYGAFLAQWAVFEIAIEVKIAKLANLTSLDASIILGGLNFGSKPSILYSLLRERGLDGVVDKVRAVIDHARRNALVHGIPWSEEDDPQFVFFKREVGDTYKVKQLPFTAESFNQHFEKLCELIAYAFEGMGLTLWDLHKY